MSKISDFKNRALAQLKGNWTQPVLLALVYMLISSGVSSIFSFIPFLLPLVLLIYIPLVFGMSIAMLGFYRGEKEDIIPKLFDPFRDYSRMLTTGLLMFLYIFLWSLLLWIPGIIKGLSYAMTPYILKDNPELKNNGAIELSMAMMEGRKMQLFLLQLSFIGWAFLCILTLCIGLFWLVPYMEATMAAFYEEVKEEYESKQAAA